MNDFTEIEVELKRLRPVRVGDDFIARVERGMEGADSATPSGGMVKRRPRFHINWLALGLGATAAAAFLVLIRIDNFGSRRSTAALAANHFASPIPRLPLANALVPDGLTQVVYNTRDEGVVFPSNSPEPMRRVRKQSRETLQWRNPQTGASLRVTYPTEQVDLIPISGQ